jgi:Na+/melibiose symporter and related transporters
MTAVCYFAGCIVALLVFSRLSDFIGRKKIGITTIILSMVGLILLINTHNGVTLLLARTVQGFSCGLGSSTLSVLIIESGINKNENLVSAIAGSAVLLGLAFGGFLSGTVAQFFSNSSNLTYILILLLLVVDLLGLLSGIETTDLQKGVWKSLRRAVLLQPGLLEGIFRPLVPQLVKLFLT